ncbi:hypothetical protein [Natronolimnobius baerhuensis]|uniref:hypothetical protein n=1 Tax=Natronolimnobius baerhuensis TaxID=253108 RepID=UPI0015959919|nr:hypothetical protein [Natronolimnobius baerhuensis]
MGAETDAAEVELWRMPTSDAIDPGCPDGGPKLECNTHLSRGAAGSSDWTKRRRR